MSDINTLVKGDQRYTKDNVMHPARFEWETREAYQLRRKVVAKELKQYLKGRVVLPSKNK